MSVHVFAFGSNMCSGRLRAYSIMPERPGQPALLSGYHLRFNKASQDGSGKANVERDPSAETWGVLYSIPDAQLSVLDRREGSGYKRQREAVHTATGTKIDAWVYVASAPVADPTLRPYGWYKRFLVEGAREHGLPERYVEALDTIEAVDDPKHQRDVQKRALQCRDAG